MFVVFKTSSDQSENDPTSSASSSETKQKAILSMIIQGLHDESEKYNAIACLFKFGRIGYS